MVDSSFQGAQRGATMHRIFLELPQITGKYHPTPFFKHPNDHSYPSHSSRPLRLSSREASRRGGIPIYSARPLTSAFSWEAGRWFFAVSLPRSVSLRRTQTVGPCGRVCMAITPMPPHLSSIFRMIIPGIILAGACRPDSLPSIAQNHFHRSVNAYVANILNSAVRSLVP